MQWYRRLKQWLACTIYRLQWKWCAKTGRLYRVLYCTWCSTNNYWTYSLRTWLTHAIFIPILLSMCWLFHWRSCDTLLVYCWATVPPNWLQMLRPLQLRRLNAHTFLHNKPHCNLQRLWKRTAVYVVLKLLWPKHFDGAQIFNCTDFLSPSFTVSYFKRS